MIASTMAKNGETLAMIAKKTAMIAKQLAMIAKQLAMTGDTMDKSDNSKEKTCDTMTNTGGTYGILLIEWWNELVRNDTSYDVLLKFGNSEDRRQNTEGAFRRTKESCYPEKVLKIQPEKNAYLAGHLDSAGDRLGDRLGDG